MSGRPEVLATVRSLPEDWPEGRWFSVVGCLCQGGFSCRAGFSWQGGPPVEEESPVKEHL